MEQSDFLAQQKQNNTNAMFKILLITGISLIFMIGEIVGGYLSGSLAIITDAAHMLSDVAGFLISAFAIYMGNRPSNYQMSFGYHRAEILGALASIMLIWGIIIYLFIEAIHRIFHPEAIDGEIMLITACVGLVCNLISIFTLHSCGGGHHHHHHDEETKQVSNEEERKLSHCHQPALSGQKKNKKFIIEVETTEEDTLKLAQMNNEPVLLYEDINKTPEHRPVNYSVAVSDNSLFIDRKSVAPTITGEEIQNEESPLKEHSKCDHDDDKHDHKHDHKHEHGGHGSHAGHNHENMNIRAAIIHIIGDIV